MKYVYATLGILAVLAGIVLLAAAKSALHEIEAFMLFLIGAVLLVGSEIVAAVHDLAEKKVEPKE